VVGAGRKILFPRPFVLERHELIDIGLAVDDAFVLDRNAAMCIAGTVALLRGRRFERSFRRDGAHSHTVCLRLEIVFEAQHRYSSAIWRTQVHLPLSN
jgi:hypothetical protein